MSDIALAIDGVDKIYQRRGKPPVHAVKALDMAIQKGEIVALLGSSGCGKTSTLRMIAGFEDVSNGSITLAGRRIEHLHPAKRNVAMAFEGYSLYPPLTVRDNIAFALKSSRMPPRRGREDRCRESPRLSRSTRSSTATPPRSRAASSSGRAWPGRWCAAPTSICSTSRWASSSRSCARCCAAGSRACCSSAA